MSPNLPARADTWRRAKALPAYSKPWMRSLKTKLSFPINFAESSAQLQRIPRRCYRCILCFDLNTFFHLLFTALASSYLLRIEGVYLIVRFRRWFRVMAVGRRTALHSFACEAEQAMNPGARKITPVVLPR